MLLGGGKIRLLPMWRRDTLPGRLEDNTLQVRRRVAHASLLPRCDTRRHVRAHLPIWPITLHSMRGLSLNPRITVGTSVHTRALINNAPSLQSPFSTVS